MAASSLGVCGIIIVGWSINSKFVFLGGPTASGSDGIV